MCVCVCKYVYQFSEEQRGDKYYERKNATRDAQAKDTNLKMKKMIAHLPPLRIAGAIGKLVAS